MKTKNFLGHLLHIELIKIIENTKISDWHYVSTRSNIADCATKTPGIQQLVNKQTVVKWSRIFKRHPLYPRYTFTTDYSE